MEPTIVSLPWLDIAKLALGTGFVAALITQGVGWLREWRRDTKAAIQEATYLALRVATTLERFAIDCASVISDNIAFKQSDGDKGNFRTKLPVLQSYPGDLDWKSIDPSLAAGALALPNELVLSRESISAAFDIDVGLGASECNKHAGLRGYRAERLAADLRAKYALPTFDTSETAWDFKNVLQVEYDKAIKFAEISRAVNQQN